MAFNAIVWQEGRLFVAQCVELDVASQGYTQEEALANLKEAVDLYLEDESVVSTPHIKNLQLAQLSVGK